ncbi:GNAT family N-acetyltransferase [Dyadobacter bucti]|uniref:GNAT family N-acetyltransferase n=1 Tax=Dyadobacter bucti TaxID=2572203 RepID=UPI003F70EC95
MVSTDFFSSDLEQLRDLQPADWGDLVPRFRYFIDSPFCKPIKITERAQVIAIGTSMFHKDTAWLACIVVHPDHRKKGLGNTITKELIDGIDRKHYPTIYLDATDFGYPVYKKLGFEVETEYAHYIRNQKTEGQVLSENLLEYEQKFRQEVLELDRKVSGEDRRGILNDFIDSAMLYVNNSKVEGFYIPGWGDGPVLAVTDVAGTELMKLRIQTYDNAVFPVENAISADFVTDNNFVFRKTSRRMYLGPKRVWQPRNLYNWISGQLG